MAGQETRFNVLTPDLQELQQFSSFDEAAPVLEKGGRLVDVDPIDNGIIFLSPDKKLSKVSLSDVKQAFSLGGVPVIRDPRDTSRILMYQPDGNIGSVNMADLDKAFAVGGRVFDGKVMQQAPTQRRIVNGFVTGWIGKPIPVQRLYNIPGGKEFLRDMTRAQHRIGLGGTLGHWTTQDIPWLGEALAAIDITKIARTAKKLSEGEDVPEEDLVALNHFLLLNDMRANASLSGKIGQVVKDSISFGLEFATWALIAAALAPSSATGVGTAAEAGAVAMAGRALKKFGAKAFGFAARKKVESSLRKYLTRAAGAKIADRLIGKLLIKAPAAAVGAAYKGGLMAVASQGIQALATVAAGEGISTRQAATRQVYSALTEDQESYLTSLVKGALSDLIERSTEFMGEDLVKGFSLLTTKAPVLGQFASEIRNKVIAAAKAKGISAAVAKNYFNQQLAKVPLALKVGQYMLKKGITGEKALETLRQLGFDGIWGEFLEERAGGFLHGLFGTETDESGIKSAIKNAIPSTEDAAAELIAFSIPGVTARVIDSTQGKVTGLLGGLKTIEMIFNQEQKVIPEEKETELKEQLGEVLRLEKQYPVNAHKVINFVLDLAATALTGDIWRLAHGTMDRALVKEKLPPLTRVYNLLTQNLEKQIAEQKKTLPPKVIREQAHREAMEILWPFLQQYHQLLGISESKQKVLQQLSKKYGAQLKFDPEAGTYELIFPRATVLSEEDLKVPEGTKIKGKDYSNWVILLGDSNEKKVTLRSPSGQQTRVSRSKKLIGRALALKQAESESSTLLGETPDLEKEFQKWALEKGIQIKIRGEPLSPKVLLEENQALYTPEEVLEALSPDAEPEVRGRMESIFMNLAGLNALSLPFFKNYESVLVEFYKQLRELLLTYSSRNDAAPVAVYTNALYEKTPIHRIPDEAAVRAVVRPKKREAGEAKPLFIIRYENRKGEAVGVETVHRKTPWSEKGVWHKQEVVDIIFGSPLRQQLTEEQVNTMAQTLDYDPVLLRRKLRSRKVGDQVLYELEFGALKSADGKRIYLNPRASLPHYLEDVIEARQYILNGKEMLSGEDKTFLEALAWAVSASSAMTKGQRAIISKLIRDPAKQREFFTKLIYRKALGYDAEHYDFIEPLVYNQEIGYIPDELLDAAAKRAGYSNFKSFINKRIDEWLGPQALARFKNPWLNRVDLIEALKKASKKEQTVAAPAYRSQPVTAKKQTTQRAQPAKVGNLEIIPAETVSEKVAQIKGQAKKRAKPQAQKAHAAEEQVQQKVKPKNFAPRKGTSTTPREMAGEPLLPEEKAGLALTPEEKAEAALTSEEQAATTLYPEETVSAGLTPEEFMGPEISPQEALPPELKAKDLTEEEQRGEVPAGTVSLFDALKPENISKALEKESQEKSVPEDPQGKDPRSGETASLLADRKAALRSVLTQMDKAADIHDYFERYVFNRQPSEKALLNFFEFDLSIPLPVIGYWRKLRQTGDESFSDLAFDALTEFMDKHTITEQEGQPAFSTALADALDALDALPEDLAEQAERGDLEESIDVQSDSDLYAEERADSILQMLETRYVVTRMLGWMLKQYALIEDVPLALDPQLRQEILRNPKAVAERELSLFLGKVREQYFQTVLENYDRPDDEVTELKPVPFLWSKEDFNAWLEDQATDSPIIQLLKVILKHFGYEESFRALQFYMSRVPVVSTILFESMENNKPKVQFLVNTSMDMRNYLLDLVERAYETSPEVFKALQKRTGQDVYTAVKLLTGSALGLLRSSKQRLYLNLNDFIVQEKMSEPEKRRIYRNRANLANVLAALTVLMPEITAYLNYDAFTKTFKTTADFVEEFRRQVNLIYQQLSDVKRRQHQRIKQYWNFAVKSFVGQSYQDPLVSAVFELNRILDSRRAPKLSEISALQHLTKIKSQLLTGRTERRTIPVSAEEPGKETRQLIFIPSVIGKLARLLQSTDFAQDVYLEAPALYSSVTRTPEQNQIPNYMLISPAYIALQREFSEAPIIRFDGAVSTITGNRKDTRRMDVEEIHKALHEYYKVTGKVLVPFLMGEKHRIFGLALDPVDKSQSYAYNYEQLRRRVDKAIQGIGWKSAIDFNKRASVFNTQGLITIPRKDGIGAYLNVGIVDTAPHNFDGASLMRELGRLHRSQGIDPREPTSKSTITGILPGGRPFLNKGLLFPMLASSATVGGIYDELSRILRENPKLDIVTSTDTFKTLEEGNFAYSDLKTRKVPIIRVPSFFVIQQANLNTGNYVKPINLVFQLLTDIIGPGGQDLKKHSVFQALNKLLDADEKIIRQRQEVDPTIRSAILPQFRFLHYLLQADVSEQNPYIVILRDQILAARVLRALKPKVEGFNSIAAPGDNSPQLFDIAKDPRDTSGHNSFASAIILARPVGVKHLRYGAWWDNLSKNDVLVKVYRALLQKGRFIDLVRPEILLQVIRKRKFSILRPRKGESELKAAQRVLQVSEFRDQELDKEGKPVRPLVNPSSGNPAVFVPGMPVLVNRSPGTGLESHIAGRLGVMPGKDVSNLMFIHQDTIRRAGVDFDGDKWQSYVVPLTQQTLETFFADAEENLYHQHRLAEIELVLTTYQALQKALYDALFYEIDTTYYKNRSSGFEQAVSQALQPLQRPEYSSLATTVDLQRTFWGARRILGPLVAMVGTAQLLIKSGSLKLKLRGGATPFLPLTKQGDKLVFLKTYLLPPKLQATENGQILGQVLRETENRLINMSLDDPKDPQMRVLGFDRSNASLAYLALLYTDKEPFLKAAEQRLKKAHPNTTISFRQIAEEAMNDLLMRISDWLNTPYMRLYSRLWYWNRRYDVKAEDQVQGRNLFGLLAEIITGNFSNVPKALEANKAFQKEAGEVAAQFKKATSQEKHNIEAMATATEILYRASREFFDFGIAVRSQNWHIPSLFDYLKAFKTFRNIFANSYRYWDTRGLVEHPIIRAGIQRLQVLADLVYTEKHPILQTLQNKKFLSRAENIFDAQERLALLHEALIPQAISSAAERLSEKDTFYSDKIAGLVANGKFVELEELLLQQLSKYKENSALQDNEFLKYLQARPIQGAGMARVYTPHYLEHLTYSEVQKIHQDARNLPNVQDGLTADQFLNGLLINALKHWGIQYSSHQQNYVQLLPPIIFQRLDRLLTIAQVKTGNVISSIKESLNIFMQPSQQQTITLRYTKSTKIPIRATIQYTQSGMITGSTIKAVLHQNIKSVLPKLQSVGWEVEKPSGEAPKKTKPSASLVYTVADIYKKDLAKDFRRVLAQAAFRASGVRRNPNTGKWERPVSVHRVAMRKIHDFYVQYIEALARTPSFIQRRVLMRQMEEEARREGGEIYQAWGFLQPRLESILNSHKQEIIKALKNIGITEQDEKNLDDLALEILRTGKIVRGQLTFDEYWDNDETSMHDEETTAALLATMAYDQVTAKRNIYMFGPDYLMKQLVDLRNRVTYWKFRESLDFLLKSKLFGFSEGGRLPKIEIDKNGEVRVLSEYTDITLSQDEQEHIDQLFWAVTAIVDSPLTSHRLDEFDLGLEDPAFKNVFIVWGHSFKDPVTEQEIPATESVWDFMQRFKRTSTYQKLRKARRTLNIISPLAMARKLKKFYDDVHADIAQYVPYNPSYSPHIWGLGYYDRSTQEALDYLNKALLELKEPPAAQTLLTADEDYDFPLISETPQPPTLHQRELFQRLIKTGVQMPILAEELDQMDKVEYATFLRSLLYRVLLMIRRAEVLGRAPGQTEIVFMYWYNNKNKVLATVKKLDIALHRVRNKEWTSRQLQRHYKGTYFEIYQRSIQDAERLLKKSGDFTDEKIPESLLESLAIKPKTMNALLLRHMYVSDVFATVANQSLLNEFLMTLDVDGAPLLLAVPNPDYEAKQKRSIISPEVLYNSLRSAAAFVRMDPDIPRQNLYETASKIVDRLGDEYVAMPSYFPSITKFYVRRGASEQILKHLIQKRRTRYIAGRDVYEGLAHLVQWSKIQSVGYSFFFPATLLESTIEASGVKHNVLWNWKNGKPRILEARKLARRLLEGDYELLPIVSEMVRAGLIIEFETVLDTPRHLVARDIDTFVESIRQRWGERAAHKMNLLLQGISGHWLTEVYFGATSKGRLGIFPALKIWTTLNLAQELMKQRGLDFTNPEHRRRIFEEIIPYVNAGIGGVNWNSYYWATPVVRQFMNLLLFAPTWSISTLNVAGGGLITGQLLDNAPSQAEWNLIKRNWRARALVVLTLLPMAVQAISYALGSVLLGGGDDDDKKKALDDKIIPWLNEIGRKTYVDLTPLARRLNIFYRGEPTGNRRVYVRWGKQTWEVITGWMMDPVQTFLRKLSQPAKFVFEMLTGKSPGSDWDLEFEGQGLRGWFLVEEPSGEVSFIKSRFGYLLQKFIPMSFTSFFNNPDAFPANFFAPVSKGHSFGRSVVELTAVLNTYASETHWKEYRKHPKNIRNLRSLGVNILDAAARNGFDPEKVLNTARGTVLSRLYRQFFQALESNNPKAMDQVARSILRVHGTAKGLLSSLRYRYEQKGMEVPPEVKTKVTTMLQP